LADGGERIQVVIGVEIVEVKQIVSRQESGPGDINRVKLAASRIKEKPHRATAQTVADGQSPRLAPGCDRLHAEQLGKGSLIEADWLSRCTNVALKSLETDVRNHKTIWLLQLIVRASYCHKRR